MGNTFNTNLRWVGYQVQNNILYGEPDVFIFAQEGSWGPLIEISFRRPSDVQFKDRCRNTALHLACRRQPPIDAIQALIRAYPTALAIRTVDGMTPLHFACYCGASSDAVRLLIECCPDSASKLDKRGRSPLHCACAGCRTEDKYEVLKLLLEVYPQMVLIEDSLGRTPLSLMLDDYIEEVEEITCCSAKFPRKKLSTEIEDCLKCTSILLRAAYHGSASDLVLKREPFRMLHASVGVSCCPPLFVRLALKIQPEQVRTPDIHGNLPLHIAAATHQTFQTNKSDTRFNVIQSIISMYPAAAKISNRNGLLPLALAMEHKKSWEDCIRPLIEAHPAALATIQIDIKNFPFVLHKIARTSSPTILYDILRAKPEIVPVKPLLGEYSKEYTAEITFQDWNQ